MASKIPPGLDLNTTPIGINPHGAPPNFVNPPSLNQRTYGLTSTMLVLAFLFVGLRLLSTVKKDGRLRMDDYFCVLALILSTVYGIIVMIMNETSRHSWDTPLAFINATWLKRDAVLCIIFGPAMFFAKAAVCTLYMRIFEAIVWMRYTMWALLTFIFISYFSMVPIYAYFAFPWGHQKWDLALTDKTSRVDQLAVAAGALNVFSDLLLLTLPVPIIMKLNLSIQKRIGLAAVFLTGIIGIVATGFGLYFRVMLFLTRSDLAHGDTTWVAASTYITVMIELCITVIVSCVPGCVSSWRNVLSKTAFFTSIRGRHGSSPDSPCPFKSFKRSPEVQNKSRTPSFFTDEAFLTSKHELEFEPRRDLELGILKTVKIQQSGR